MSFDVLGELVQLGWVSFLGFALMFFPCFLVFSVGLWTCSVGFLYGLAFRILSIK